MLPLTFLASFALSNFDGEATLPYDFPVDNSHVCLPSAGPATAEAPNGSVSIRNASFSNDGPGERITGSVYNSKNVAVYNVRIRAVGERRGRGEQAGGSCQSESITVPQILPGAFHDIEIEFLLPGVEQWDIRVIGYEEDPT